MYNRDSILYRPIDFENIRLPGRLVRSATELFKSNRDGSVSDFEVEHYKRLADQPLGMVITAHSCVMPEGRSNFGQNAVWDDRFMDGQKTLCDIIHGGEFGTKIILQLGHGGERSKANDGRKVMFPDNMTVDDIASVREHFTSAAIRAKNCGFDGVQIHAAHGYLLSLFFYPEKNHRTDEYGESAENRFRLIGEIAASIKSACGSDFPVFLKLNGTDAPFTADVPCSAEYLADLKAILPIAKSVGIEGFEVSGYHSSPQGEVKSPYFLGVASELAAVGALPIMLVGGIRCEADALSAFERGIKTVSICRPLICDMDFAQTISLGAKSSCIGCNKCFSDLYCHVSEVK